MKDTSLEAYRDHDFSSNREKVWEYIKKHEGLTQQEIIEKLELNRSNCTRISELEKAGYVTAVKKFNESKNCNEYVYYAKQGKVYNYEDFKGLIAKSKHPDHHLAVEIGSILLSVVSSDCTNEQKGKVINNFLDYYRQFYKDKDKKKFKENMETVNKLFNLYLDSLKY